MHALYALLPSLFGGKPPPPKAAPVGRAHPDGSPVGPDDALTREYNDSAWSVTAVRRKYATWELNPLLPWDSRLIQAAFAKDRASAWRNFGAELNPPTETCDMTSTDSSEYRQ